MKDLRRDMDHMAHLIQMSVAEPVWSINQVALDRLRDAILESDVVVAIKVEDEYGKTLASGKKVNVSMLSFEEMKQEQNLLFHEVPIQYEGGPIGMVKIATSNEKAIRSVRDNTLIIIGFTIIMILLLGAVVTLIGSRLLQRPIRELKDSAVGLANGDLDQQFNLDRPDELGILARSFAEMRDSIRLKIMDLKLLNRISEKLANVDSQEEAMQTMLKIISKKIGSENAMAFVKRRDDIFYRVASFNEGTKAIPVRFRDGEGLFGKIIPGVSPLFIRDSFDCPVYLKEDYEAWGEGMVLSVPLIDERRVLGVMSFTGAPKTLRFDDVDREFVATASRLMVATLSNLEMLSVIRQQNRTLEKKVLDKTTAIRDLLDNTGQGFLSFNEDFIIDSEYSKTCEFFFCQSIGGCDVMKLLFNADKKNDLMTNRQMLTMIFKGNVRIPQLRELLPDEIFIHNRFLSIDYRWIVPSENSKSEKKIMLILTDVTREKELAKRLSADEDRKNLIIKIALDKDGFIHFLGDLEDNLVSIYQSFEQPIDRIDVDKLFRTFHTIKGGSATYGLKAITTLTHEIENQLDRFRKDELPIDLTTVLNLKKQTQELEVRLEEYLETMDDIIPIEERMSKKRSYRISDQKIRNLENFMVNIVDKNYLQKIQKELEILRFQPIGTYFRKYAHSAEQLALQLKKEVQVQLIGAGIEVSFQKMEKLLSALIHLIRNCVDHGIERKETRVMLGKPKAGTLVIEAGKEGNRLLLRISDDGAGIDTEQIRKIGLEREVISNRQYHTMTNEEIISLIFKPGFSTNEIISDISGRGVGMDAVKIAVDELGGDISIDTKPYHGTSFQISIPHS